MTALAKIDMEIWGDSLVFHEQFFPTYVPHLIATRISGANICILHVRFPSFSSFDPLISLQLLSINI